MEPELIGIFAVGVAILGFLWSLHREVAGLRKCMVRIEGLLVGLIRR